MANQLFDGKQFRILTLVDNFTRESLAIEVGQNFTVDKAVALLERALGGSPSRWKKRKKWHHSSNSLALVC